MDLIQNRGEADILQQTVSERILETRRHARHAAIHQVVKNVKLVADGLCERVRVLVVASCHPLTA